MPNICFADWVPIMFREKLSFVVVTGIAEAFEGELVVFLI